MNGLSGYHTWLAQGFGKEESLYRCLKEQILDGRLKQGDVLPSTREAARALQLSRGTVITAYDRLRAEGLALAQQGGYTLVAYSAEDRAPREQQAPLPRLSGFGARVLALKRNEGISSNIVKHENDILDLSPQECTGLELSRETWQRWMREAVREFAWQKKRMNPFEADESSLEAAIELHLMRHRGVEAHRSNIRVTRGSQEAIMLLVQALINPGERVLIETPGYAGIRYIVESVGGIPEYYNVQDSNQLGDILSATAAKLMILTPNRQFPTGATMEWQQRSQVLRWAEEQDALIIEDDFDSDFGLGSKRYELLQSMDHAERVLYVGSFSRTIHPTLRLGYMVIPSRLVPIIDAIRGVYHRYEAIPMEERALALFMRSGAYERHLRRVRRIISQRAPLYSERLSQAIGSLMEWKPDHIALHIYAEWKGSPSSYAAFKQLAWSNGVSWKDGCIYEHLSCDHNLEPTIPFRPSALFGLAHMNQAEWELGCQRLRLAAQSMSSF